MNFFIHLFKTNRLLSTSRRYYSSVNPNSKFDYVKPVVIYANADKVKLNILAYNRKKKIGVYRWINAYIGSSVLLI